MAVAAEHNQVRDVVRPANTKRNDVVGVEFDLSIATVGALIAIPSIDLTTDTIPIFGILSSLRFWRGIA